MTPTVSFESSRISFSLTYFTEEYFCSTLCSDITNHQLTLCKYQQTFQEPLIFHNKGDHEVKNVVSLTEMNSLSCSRKIRPTKLYIRI